MCGIWLTYGRRFCWNTPVTWTGELALTENNNDELSSIRTVREGTTEITCSKNIHKFQTPDTVSRLQTRFFTDFRHIREQQTQDV
ncbi:Hypp9090 [Branchiostoma lanceolatum]|uniref:Hypp9090 protein n=1 Tax=Branchiostoma lanceolatum TaxID=7740 RepID=A0A8J9ZBP6_BRALA|nr:Hypp9090 [Branchiostoma lanceolatum]